MINVKIPIDQFLSIRHCLAIGASAVAANYADSLVNQLGCTRGVYLKALASVQYDRAYALLETTTSDYKESQSHE